MLYVANADNNCVAAIDIESPRRSEVKGFIPTGWYPTSIAMTPDGKQLLVGVGKGNQTQANRPAQATLDALLAKPREGGYRDIPIKHVGTTLSGALSIVDVPDDAELASYTSPGLSQLSLLRRAFERGPGGERAENGDSGQSRRPLADPARDLHHQGEPHL